jgi:hypothetical protein
MLRVRLKKLRHSQSVVEYLASLSTKHEVYPSEFFYALVAAGESGTSTCGGLSIVCRGKTADKITFLVKKGSEIVAQFPVSTVFLCQEGNPLSNFTQATIMPRRNIVKTEQRDSYMIKDLHAGMNHVNLSATVLEISAPRRVTTRYGNYATLAKALIEDETGKIKLCLWNQQIDSVSKGDTVQISDARASRFNGETQLSIGTKGALHKQASIGQTVSLDVADAKLKTAPEGILA